MNPISVAFAFIAGYLVVGAGAFTVCSAIHYLKTSRPMRLALHQMATGLGAIGGGLALTAVGLYGVASLALR